MDSVVISILTGFITSSLFLLFLSKLRPKIVISECIAVRDEDGKQRYVIKVINRGTRNAINLKAELSMVAVRIVPDGNVYSTRTLTLNKDAIFTLAKLDMSNDEANYAYRFATIDDVEGIWRDDSREFLRFKLYAQDEMSNFGKVFAQDFRTKRNTIKKGEFRFGESLDVA